MRRGSESPKGRGRGGLARLALVGGALTGLGCGESFAPGSEVSTLRVLGVTKSEPYARPGERTELTLLWHDALASPRPPQIAWFALCQNPDGDLFELCFEDFARLAPTEAGSGPAADEETNDATQGLDEAALAALVSLPGDPQQANDRFAFELPNDIITSRPPPKDPQVVPYGLNFVFFAVCAGRLGLASEAGTFPIACYEPDGTEGFEPGPTQLGSDRFVFGYTAVYAYERLRNQNPRIRGVRFGNRLLQAAQANGSTGLLTRDLCVGDDCLSEDRDDSAACAPELTVRCDGQCDEVSLQPLIDPGVAEVDEVASQLSDRTLLEQLWVNYYADGGSVGKDVALLNDATSGWNADFGTTYRPPAEPGVHYVWAVAHDNRGGSGWLRVRVCVEAPP